MYIHESVVQKVNIIHSLKFQMLHSLSIFFRIKITELMTLKTLISTKLNIKSYRSHKDSINGRIQGNTKPRKWLACIRKSNCTMTKKIYCSQEIRELTPEEKEAESEVIERVIKCTWTKS